MAKFAVTRTVETTEAVALVFDKTTAESFNRTVTLGHKPTNDAALERTVRRIIEADSNLKLIEVVDITVTSKLLGITEEDFLAHAVELDPKTRKPLAN